MTTTLTKPNMPPTSTAEASDLAQPFIAETLTACPNCGNNNAAKLSYWCQSPDRYLQVSSEAFVFSKCKKCSLVFQSKRPTEDTVGVFYTEEYGPYNPGKFKLLTPKQQKLKGLKKFLLENFNKLHKLQRQILQDKTAKQIDAAYKKQPTQGLFLDYGCGAPKGLNMAKKLGWQNTVGADFSEFVIENVKASGHDCYAINDALWGTLGKSSVGFVRMNHVLEHLYRPREIMGKIYDSMLPNACLHLAVPNPEGLTAKLFKSHWFGLEVPRHCMMYPPRLLKEFIESLGYTNVTILHEAAAKDLARSIGYLLYDWGFPFEDQGEQLMHNSLLIMLIYPISRLAALFGFADRLHVIAYKPSL